MSIKETLKNKFKKVLRKKFHLELRYTADKLFPKDMDPEFEEIFRLCKPYTMTSIERMYALYRGVQHVASSGIKGDFVECGVWKGGSAMVIAMTLLKNGISDRKIYLYDTFEGMPKPDEIDKEINEDVSSSVFVRWKMSAKDNVNDWCYAPLEEVKKAMALTGYPKDNLVFTKGKIEDTIPGTSPECVAVLRIDTDWHSSTAHAMRHLFPRLSTNGVLVLDDYGYWEGARKAVDDYLAESHINILLNRVDAPGYIGIKT